ncbi:MAG: hypothetical protein U5N10_14195 [Gemmobacter sp.]|nr:hypothetical protein [Gemmobacter sp.]
MAEQETPLVLAIDAGGTAVKVALVAPDGRVIAQRHAAGEAQHLPDGRSGPMRRPSGRRPHKPSGHC